jgi:hypothetical protein
MSQEAYQLRRKFIALVEDIFRELGHEAPAMTHDTDLPLAMELELEEVPFEVVHSTDNRPQDVVIACRFGAVPTERAVAALTKLLEENMTLAREHKPTFGADPENNSVVRSYTVALEGATASAVLGMMREAAEHAKQWQNGFYLEEDKQYVAPAPTMFQALA